MFKNLLKTMGLVAKSPTVPPEDRPAHFARPLPTDVTDADFTSIVLQSDKLAIVDFWADWCEPCHVMSAWVGFLATEFQGQVLVAALDVDENPDTPGHYNIMGLPTLLFLRNGVEIDRVIGVVNYQELKQKVEHWLAVNHDEVIRG
jgi:thioredoxin 1